MNCLTHHLKETLMWEPHNNNNRISFPHSDLKEPVLLTQLQPDIQPLLTRQVFSYQGSN